MKYIFLSFILTTCEFTPAFAEKCRTDLAQDGCSLVMVCGDQPGVSSVLQRTCSTISKKDWARQTHLDTTVVVDTTKTKKDSTKTK